MHISNIFYSSMFLAVADPNSMFSTVATWIGRIIFLLAVIQFTSGCLKWHNDPSEAKSAFIKAALLAFSWGIVTLLFNNAGMPVVNISP